MLGLVLFCLRFDFKAAEKSYLRAIELDPRSLTQSSNTPIYCAKREGWTRRKNRSGSARVVARIPVLAVKQAEIQRDRKQPDAAIATLTEALLFVDDVRRAHVALGAAWEAKGDFEQALTRYRQALGMNPEDRRALPALGYLLGCDGPPEGGPGNGVATRRHECAGSQLCLPGCRRLFRLSNTRRPSIG